LLDKLNIIQIKGAEEQKLEQLRKAA
jgi:hypothetical protein